MANSQAFDWVCAEVETATSLSNLEARGTVRLALKSAGLDASSVGSRELGVLLEKVLPGELDSRGIADSGAICSGIASRMGQASLESAGGESPEDVFRRLGS